MKFEISKWKAPRVLSFSLRSKVLNESVNFDVLPAFNALGETPRPRPSASGGGSRVTGQGGGGGRAT